MKIKNERNLSTSSPTKIITVQVFYLWLYFLYQRKNSGKGEREQRSRRRGGKKQGCRQDYWSAMDAVTGNRWERKCAESREQEL